MSPAPSRDEAAAFLKRVAEAPAGVFPAIGLGEDLRLQAPGLAGGALAFDGALLHLCAFNLPGQESRLPMDDGGTMRRRKSGRRPSVS